MYIQGKETDKITLNVLKALWERHKRAEILRKQMNMTKEPDILLIHDLSCGPIPVEIEDKKQIEESWR